MEQLEIARWLVEEVADVDMNALERRGCTALQVALISGNIPVAAYLMSRHSDYV